MVRVWLSVCAICWSVNVFAGTHTWDGRYSTENIEVTIVYFVPADRQPLKDWRERVEYYSRRIEQFHDREFQGQSQLKTVVRPEPLISDLNTQQLRRGDGDAIFFRTLRETDRRIEFAKDKGEAFPILLVLSEINWRPLDDFYRGQFNEGKFQFEGNLNRRLEHFPGATSGGARATYLAGRGVGWGLVSADGWRVPYRGSDCVVYHEGVGHTVGLPHPEPADSSVMSLAQYRGWISESFVEKNQKSRLGWEPHDRELDSQSRLFSKFRAVADPAVPKPGQPVTLRLDWPETAIAKSLRVRFQTDIHGPWQQVPQKWDASVPKSANLGVFERATPVSYRVDAELEDGSTAELWGYFQVRDNPREPVVPRPSADLAPVVPISSAGFARPKKLDSDLLKELNLDESWKRGEWKLEAGILVSPKAYGARIEFDQPVPDEYVLTAVVQPLDEPNGLLLGHVVGQHRFVTLFHFANGNTVASAVENVDGKNVGNETTVAGPIFAKNQVSQIVVRVTKQGVTALVDGAQILEWKGDPSRLSFSDYWSTPNKTALMMGAYNCRYRVHRLSIRPL